MRKKISHSDISLYVMPVYNSTIRKCKVCNRKINNHCKMIVFNEMSMPIGFNCNYCHSVYADNGGMHIEMFNLKTVYGDAGAGANTIATITGTVYIKKWGSETKVMTLDTGRFLTCN